MDIERAVVTKILTTGNFDLAITRGIRADHFADEECREMFEYVSEKVRKYKTIPSPESIKDDKPDFEWLHQSDSLEYLLDKFVIVVKRRFAQEMAVELAKAADDPSRGPTIDLEFLEVARKLATLVPSTEIAQLTDMDKRIEEYKIMAKEGKKPGIPFGFRTLDEWTGGIQKHEFVTVAGFSGTGKSTLLRAIAFNAWMNGKTPLIITLEEGKQEVFSKLDSMVAGVNYWRLKHMGLEESEIEAWEKKAEWVKENGVNIPVIDSIRGCTPEHVFAETVRHKPDLVIVDYLSLMRSSRPSRNMQMWQSLTEVTQDLKQNARTLNIPILAAAQTNRAASKDGSQLDNIGYSLSVVQDSDVVIGMHQDEEMKERKEMELRLNKNRRGRVGQIKAIWDHDNMLFREKEEKDMFQRRDIIEPDSQIPNEAKIKLNDLPKKRPRPGGNI